MAEEPKVYMCGLWRKKDRTGREYLVGEMSDNTVMFVFPNNRTGGDDPDYSVFIRERRKDGSLDIQAQDQARSEFPE